MRRSLVVALVVAVVAGCTPSEKPKEQAGAGAAAASSSWVKIAPSGGPLAAQLKSKIAGAPPGTKPVVYVGATWCGPCVSIKKTKSDPLMVDAFRGAFVIELDLDEWKDADLTPLGYKTGAIPVFFAVDGEGKALGPKIDGGAWGDNVPANMAPPLKKFVASLP
ncbi:MAG: hypothetical protein JNL38_02120 [Myxococcales bacterium]|nr:hypothetical protein [Myxococcales bacterium]